MTLITNLCPWPNGTVKRTEWNTQATQDKTTGLWTYTLEANQQTGTCPIFATTVPLGNTYVAVVSTSTPMRNVKIGRDNGTTGTNLTATSTLLIAQIDLAINSGRQQQIYLWLYAGATITPKKVALYTQSDWTLLQKTNKINWFDKDLVPLV